MQPRPLDGVWGCAGAGEVATVCGRAAERLDMLERRDTVHRQILEAAARPRDLDALLSWLRGGGFRGGRRAWRVSAGG